MKIYDTHSDVFSNIYERSLKKEVNIFKRIHQPFLDKGEVKGGIFVVYSDSDFDVLKAYKSALKEYNEFKSQYDVVYGLEGLRNVLTLDEFQKLYDLGIRHSSLTWNEENHLATGVKGNPSRGLTLLGKKFLDFMNEKEMIVDVSHLNEKSFYDLTNYTQKHIIASHSNAFELSNHPRNLKTEQLKVLREIGGMVGIVSARNFVSLDKTRQNIAGFCDQLIFVASIIGIENVTLGLDMMDFLDDYGTNSNLDDLRSHQDAQRIVKELVHRNLKLEEIELVTHKNFERLTKHLQGEIK